MSTISEMKTLITDLRGAAAAITEAANSLEALLGSKSEEETKPAPTLTEVRAVLADKSRAGFTAQIKELLIRHGSEKLSGIDPAEYSSLLKEAEELGNG